MRIRFGYVANALALWNASPSKALTFKTYSNLPKEKRIEKLMEVTSKNLEHTMRILYYNAAHEIKLYRFSSSLVPLATHPEVMWDFVTPFKEKWEELGELINRFEIRPSFHPNQFTLFTSSRDEITQNAIRDMEFHYKMLEAMRIEKKGIINIHIGGAYGDKDASINRFHQNLKKLPQEIRAQMTLENDYKTYTILETLKVSEKEKIPMILDYHHHQANQGGLDLALYLKRIFQTWEKSGQVPKVHISSPKSENAYRSHADFVSLEFVLPFLKIAKDLNQDFDVMVEAKQKDLAMLQLVGEITSLRGVKRLTTSTVEW